MPESDKNFPLMLAHNSAHQCQLRSWVRKMIAGNFPILQEFRTHVTLRLLSIDGLLKLELNFTNQHKEDYIHHIHYYIALLYRKYCTQVLAYFVQAVQFMIVTHITCRCTVLQAKHVRLYCKSFATKKTKVACFPWQESLLISAGPYGEDEVEGVTMMLSAYKQLQIRCTGCDVRYPAGKRHENCPKAAQMCVIQAATKDIIYDEWSPCDRRQLHNCSWSWK